MYHKSRRNHRRFYPEFYEDDEMEVKKDAELKSEPEPDETMQEIPAVQEVPANYNDLLYPSRIKTDSVFKQLENMQKDYIQKKLAVSRANNININPDITGSDKIINRNEAAAINENNNNNNNNNEIRIEIPDSMYTDEIQDLHNNIPEENIENINEVAESMEDNTETTEILYTMNHTVTEDVFSAPPETAEDLESPGEAVETFEHIQIPETYKIAETAEHIIPKTEQFEPLDTQIEQSFTKKSEKSEESVTHIIERDYSAHHSEPYEYNPKLIPFDKAKAIEYAHRWALDRNPNFLDFDELGGDCTNYVSQILLAGGCKMDHTPVYGWYYSSGSEKSPSWTGVEQLYNYLIKEKKYGIIAKEISAEEAEAGDIVQLSFNGRNFQHTPFIVEVSKNAGSPFHFDSIKICAHSFDSQNRALDTYQWRKIRFIHILGYLEK